jgi:hypothetical protein
MISNCHSQNNRKAKQQGREDQRSLKETQKKRRPIEKMMRVFWLANKTTILFFFFSKVVGEKR